MGWIYDEEIVVNSWKKVNWYSRETTGKSAICGNVEESLSNNPLDTNKDNFRIKPTV